MQEPAQLRIRIDLWAAAQGSAELAAIDRALSAALRARVEELLARMCDSWKAERIPQVCDLIMTAMDGLCLDWARRADAAAAHSVIAACVAFARLRLG